jgi:hypothetical protein
MQTANKWTREAIEQKVAELGADSFTNLLRQAEEMELQLTEDYVDPTQFIVWEPGIHGFCELVSADQCTCRRFKIWGRCAHHALVLEHMGLYPDEAADAA